MRFREAYDGWNEGRLSQAEAAQILGQCERSFRRHIDRYENMHWLHRRVITTPQLYQIK